MRKSWYIIILFIINKIEKCIKIQHHLKWNSTSYTLKDFFLAWMLKKLSGEWGGLGFGLKERVIVQKKVFYSIFFMQLCIE